MSAPTARLTMMVAGRWCLLGLVAASLFRPQAGHAQVICQFAPNYLLTSPSANAASGSDRRLSLGLHFDYSVAGDEQWALGGDIEYGLSRTVALVAGAGFCDPQSGLDLGPMFGANVSWAAPVTANNLWGLSVRVAWSYAVIDLGIGSQKEVAVPGIAALHFAWRRLDVYAGPVMQYTRNWTTVTTIRSAIDPGLVAGVDVRMSKRLSLNGGYSFLWIEGAEGGTGFLDRVATRMRFAL